VIRQPAASGRFLRMVRIVITEEAFKAIKATLLVGSVALSTEVTKGRRQIWLERD